MTLIRIAAVYRPGGARTGVTSYAEALKSVLEGHAQIDFMTKPPEAGYDLIHIIDIKSVRPGDFSNRQVPVVADLHDYYWSEHRYFPGPDAPLRWLLQNKRKNHYLESVQAASAVVVHSRAVAEHIENKKVYLVPIAVDFDKYYAPPSPERDPLILLVGRDSWRKGLGTLLSALKMIRSEFPELRVEVIGKEYFHTRVWARISGLGLNLEFLDEMTPEQLVKKYHQAMIVYLGSWQEGFGLSLVEGICAGCAAVGSTAGGIPEVVQDGVTGILFQPGDDLELSAKIRALLETPELRLNCALMGQDRVRERFSAGKMCESLVSAYLEVLKGAG